MSHFATTALIRKRVLEKNVAKTHIAKTIKIHESIENSLCFLHPFSVDFLIDFDIILSEFPGKKSGKLVPGGFLEFQFFDIDFLLIS